MAIDIWKAERIGNCSSWIFYNYNVPTLAEKSKLKKNAKWTLVSQKLKSCCVVFAAKEANGVVKTSIRSIKTWNSVKYCCAASPTICVADCSRKVNQHDQRQLVKTQLIPRLNAFKGDKEKNRKDWEKQEKPTQEFEMKLKRPPFLFIIIFIVIKFSKMNSRYSPFTRAWTLVWNSPLREIVPGIRRFTRVPSPTVPDHSFPFYLIF